MTEVANPIPSVNERAVMIARRNSLMNELLRIAPAASPPPRPTYKPPKVTRVLHKKNTEPPPPLPDPEPKPDVFRDDPETYTVNGVHLDLYDYFFVNADKMETTQIDKLRFINEWVKNNGKTVKDGLRKLNHIDIKLGSSDQGESKILKLYNWLRLNGNPKT